MSGRRIDDHSNWIGKGSKDSVLPKGVHVKQEKDDGMKNHLSAYEDTTEAIERQQEMGIKKMKSHNQKPLHRN